MNKLRGRHSKYNPDETPKLAEEYAKELMTDAQIMRRLGISKETFYKWIKTHIDFSDAIKRGKEAANAELLKAMRESAKGYYIEEEETTAILDRDKNPTGFKKTTRKRYIAPSTTMQIFMAKNRMPDEFRDVNRHEVDLRGKINVTTLADLMLEEFQNAGNEEKSEVES